MADPLSVLRDRYAQPDAATLLARQYQQLLDAYRPGSDSSAFDWSGVGAAMPEAYGADTPIRDPLANAVISTLTAPKRAIDASQADVEHYRQFGFGDPDYKPQALGPSMEVAAALAGGPASAEASAGEMVLGAGRVRKLPPRPPMDDLPPPPMGHNMPPEEMRLSPLADVPAQLPPADIADVVKPRTWAQDLPRPKPAARSTEIPDIRGLPVDDAIDIARTQPHLIKSGDQSEGFYVGGPRDLSSKQWLNKKRSDFDAYVAADPRGGDWYNRYRGGLSSVTGNDPVQNQWMANQEGQWSAGVDPGSELHFALKENNASIAGMPVKAARPAQHEAHLAALEAQDPDLYQLGDKTGEYARLVNPDQPLPPGGTGVNDFRHARNFGYTETSGEPQKGALTDAGHRFLDMETALAVDRANRTNLGGRSDWTGEQLQAAPWVRQKALDIQGRGGKNEDGSFKLSYDEAFERANKTITDYFPRHTAFATYEAQPGAAPAASGHMSQSVDADQAARQAFFDDPRSRWGTAPGGRDAIYSGLGVEGTGNTMRVRPTQPMQGYYRPEGGELEKNPGEVARPLVTFNVPKDPAKDFIEPQPFEPFKTTTPHDRAILNAGEAVRGLLDAQNASAWHKHWFGGPAGESNSLMFPRAGKSTPEQMSAIQDKMSQYGLGDVADTGTGVTSTSFWPPPGKNPALDKALRKGEFDQFGEPIRSRVDSDIVDYTDQWKQGTGSQAATKKMLEYVNQTPQLRDAFNRNGDIAERALARMDRDKDWASRWGAPREDIQNLRKIVGQGPGWVDRVEEAIRRGAILPAAGLALWGAAMHGGREGS